MWFLGGLVLDFLGVLALGWDVVRIQRGLRASASANAKALSKLDDDYGGTPSWLEETKRSLKWTPELVYTEYHGEDEVSYNAHRTLDLAKDTADAASGLAEYVAALAQLLQTRAQEDVNVAGMSLRLSGLGLALIGVGFLAQAHGTVLQMCHGAPSGVCSVLFWL